MNNYFENPFRSNIPALDAVAVLDGVGEDAIRQAIPKTYSLGKPFALTVTLNGVARHFAAQIDRLPTGAQQVKGWKPTVHLMLIKAGRLLRDTPVTYVVNKFTLTAKDRLEEAGFPHEASKSELDHWKALGLPLPRLAP